MTEETKESLRRFVESTTTIEDLRPIIDKIEFNNMKAFVLDQINAECIPKISEIMVSSKRIEDVIPDDVMRKILTFSSNRSRIRVVSKKWKKMTDRVNLADTIHVHSQIRESIKNDKHEISLQKAVTSIKDKQSELERKFIKAKEEFEAAYQRYHEKIWDLNELSRYQCGCCFQKGTAIAHVECDECSKPICRQCWREHSERHFWNKSQTPGKLCNACNDCTI